MDTYEEALKLMEELFARDYQFALSTCSGDKPSVRFIDTYYKDGSFWVVTYRKSRKVKDILQNPNVELCYKLFRFSGKAYDMGHPLKEENLEIRKELIKVFEPWYFAHNDENDENMCYVRIDLESGFFYKDGKAYAVDFINKTSRVFPFEVDIVITN
jgi:uncharacterized pyridoxamine 5'-phosphate oxidase family protein